MKKHSFIGIFIACLISICVFCAIIGTIYSIQETLNEQKTETNETHAANIIHPYVIKDYDASELNVETYATNVYPLYDYTPSEIGDCAEDIILMQYNLYHPNVETNIAYLNEEISSSTVVLYEMITELPNTDSIRTQSGWFIEYTFKLSSNKTSLPPVVLTRTFQTNTDFNDVREVFQPEKADMLKRRDMVIEKAIENKHKK